MSLADAASSRKERLLALRKRKAGGEDAENGENSGGPQAIRLKQRNFDPDTRTLRKRERIDAEEDTVERDVEGMADELIAEDEERRQQELDLLNIAPKRPNWDLKREMQKKLAKLDRKTTDAIHTLIRQRIISQKGGENDLVGALNAHEKGRDAEDEPASDEEE